MPPLRRKSVVILGQMTKHVVAGVVWQTAHYLVGLSRLGYDVYYVEAHASMPTKFAAHADDDVSPKAAAFIAKVMRRFDLGDNWAFQALHDDGRCYGMSEGRLRQLYASADLIINLHGGTYPLPEHCATNRLVYLETDPVSLQIELHDNQQQTIEFLAPHCAFFTFGENYGRPDCLLPVSDRFEFKPTRQPVVLDFWQPYANGARPAFTTVGNWRQLRLRREVAYAGDVYHWSKHYEFLKFIGLPALTGQSFELALSSYDEEDQKLLESNGWHVRDAFGFTQDLDDYREYIVNSRGEFTVAKDQNIRLRSGWFSDRSATYLAAGRPVITQETGFSSILPTGSGLFGFSTMEEAAQAVESINADYKTHSKGALDVAHNYFDHEAVLRPLLRELGV